MRSFISPLSLHSLFFCSYIFPFPPSIILLRSFSSWKNQTIDTFRIKIFQSCLDQLVTAFYRNESHVAAKCCHLFLAECSFTICSLLCFFSSLIDNKMDKKNNSKKRHSKIMVKGGVSSKKMGKGKRPRWRSTRLLILCSRVRTTYRRVWRLHTIVSSSNL